MAIFSRCFAIFTGFLLAGCGQKLPDLEKRNSIFFYGDVVNVSANIANIPNINSRNVDISHNSSRYDSNQINYSFQGDYKINQTKSLDSYGFSYFMVDKSPVYYKGNGLELVFIIGQNGNIASYSPGAEKISIFFSNAKKNFLFGNIDIEGDCIIYTTNQGFVRLINIKTGSVIWEKYKPEYSFYSGGVSSEGVFYAHGANGSLYAISLQNGEELWRYKPAARLDFGGGGIETMIDSARPVIYQDIIAYATKSNTLDFIGKAYGNLIFSSKLDNTAKANKSIGQTIFSVDHPIFSPLLTNSLLLTSSMYSGLHIIDPRDGRIRDIKSFGVNSPIIASENFAYLITNDADLVCISTHNGEIKWTYKLDNFRNYIMPKYLNNGKSVKKVKLNWRGPISVNNDIIVVSPFGKMLAIDANTGGDARAIDIPECVFSSPTIADNTIYLYNSCLGEMIIMNGKISHD